MWPECLTALSTRCHGIKILNGLSWYTESSHLNSVYSVEILIVPGQYLILVSDLAPGNRFSFTCLIYSVYTPATECMMTPSICTGDIALRTRSSIIRLDKWPCIRCCIFRKGKNAGLFPSISNTPNRRSFFVIPTIEAPLVTRSWGGSGGSLIPCGDGKSLQRKWQSENQWKCLYHQPSRRKCRYNGAAKRKPPFPIVTNGIT